MYLSAMSNLTTAKTAEYMAKQSEDETLSNIKEFSQSQYAHEDFLPISPQSLVKSSLNAHVQKAQAEEINNFANQQLIKMEDEIKVRYRRKKIQVTVLDLDQKPIESISFDKMTGVHHNTMLTAKKVVGVFDDASLFENVLVLVPTTTSKIVLPGRKYIAVYVVDPKTQKPLVNFRIVN